MGSLRIEIHQELVLNKLQLDCASPLAKGMRKRELTIERHHMVEIDAIEPLTPDPSYKPCQCKLAVVWVRPQGRLARNVHAVKLGVMVGELQLHRAVGEGLQVIDVDKILDIGIVGGDLDLQAFGKPPRRPPS